jgi:hypothetical protein
LLVSYKHLTTLKHTNYIQRRIIFPFSKEEVLNQRKKMTHNPKKLQIKGKREREKTLKLHNPRKKKIQNQRKKNKNMHNLTKKMNVSIFDGRRRFKSKKEKKEQEHANPNTRRKKKKIQIQEKRS